MNLAAEALRLNARYVEEVVIAWDLCPWAAQSWRRGAVARRVLRQADPAEVLPVIDELAASPEVEIGLLIFARLEIEPAAFDRFAERLRRALRPPPFLLAAFHPDLRASAADAASLVPFIRRTPDPTLQLVRSTLIDGLARGGRDLSSEIAGANFATVQAGTPAALDAVIRDIHRDRDRAYGARGR
ncbi:MAG TPA: DUF1415 family protein [Polyangia bacterium]|nr:DUF1415 family protein [Polyangia bacterium]